MKKNLVLLCMFALFALPSLGMASVIVNETNTIPIGVFIPCAVDGAGEFVVGDVRLHTLIVQTEDANGGIHTKTLDQPQGAKGVGQTTGDVYRGTGMTGNQFSVAGGGFPQTSTYINNFRWIGPGPGNNYLVHMTVHVTINANGEVTAYIDNTSAECK